MKDGTGGKRGLMVTFVALVYLAALEFTTRCVAALWTDIPGWPAKSIQRLAALSISTILFEKFVQTETFLKLYGVLWHDGNPRVFSRFHYANTTGSIAEPSG